MRSWTLLSMAMLLVIGAPSVSMAEAGAQDAAIDSPAEPQVPEQAEDAAATAPAAPEGVVSAADQPVEATDWEPQFVIPGRSDSSHQPILPLDPARPLSQMAGYGSYAFGPIGVDSEGRMGRIHTVARGDTLWDISDAYLGTPWVWPSVWNDNSDIENPHLILPEDRIWISATEMRRVSELEAAELLAAAESDDSSTLADAETEAVEEIVEVAVEEAAEAVPAAMDEMPENAPMAVAVPAPPVMHSVTINWKESMGFVSKRELDAASSIVGSSSDRIWLAQGDEVFVGLGEVQARVGDQFLIFDEFETVRDLETEQVLGYHVNNLGWLEILSLSEESSVGEIKESWFEIERGSRLLRRDSRSVTFTPTPASADIRGRIIFMPSSRTVMGTIDHVYLDVGASDGVEVGTLFDIVTQGYEVFDAARDAEVMVPDQSHGQLVIVSTQPETSVAMVAHTRDELEVGQFVQGSARGLVSY